MKKIKKEPKKQVVILDVKAYTKQLNRLGLDVFWSVVELKKDVIVECYSEQKGNTHTYYILDVSLAQVITKALNKRSKKK